MQDAEFWAWWREQVAAGRSTLPLDAWRAAMALAAEKAKAKQ